MITNTTNILKMQAYMSYLIEQFGEHATFELREYFNINEICLYSDDYALSHTIILRPDLKAPYAFYGGMGKKITIINKLYIVGDRLDDTMLLHSTGNTDISINRYSIINSSPHIIPNNDSDILDGITCYESKVLTNGRHSASFTISKKCKSIIIPIELSSLCDIENADIKEINILNSTQSITVEYISKNKLPNTTNMPFSFISVELIKGRH